MIGFGSNSDAISSFSVWPPLEQVARRDARLLPRAQYRGVSRNRGRLRIEAISVATGAGGNMLRHNRLTTFADLIQFWLAGDLLRLLRSFGDTIHAG